MSGTNSSLTSGLQNISSGLGSLSSGLQNASADSSGQDVSMTGGGANNYWTPQKMANATSMGAYDTGNNNLLSAITNQTTAGSNQATSDGNAGMGSMGLVGTPVYGNQVQQASAVGGQSSAGAGNVNNQRVYAAPINGNYVGGWTPQRMNVAKANLGNYG